MPRSQISYLDIVLLSGYCNINGSDCPILRVSSPITPRVLYRTAAIDIAPGYRTAMRYCNIPPVASLSQYLIVALSQYSTHYCDISTVALSQYPIHYRNTLVQYLSCSAIAISKPYCDISTIYQRALARFHKIVRYQVLRYWHCSKAFSAIS